MMNRIKIGTALVTALFLAVALAACKKQSGDNASNDSGTGIGPVSSVQIAAGIDEGMAKKGADLFEAKCSACHKWEEKVVGPALQGVTTRRKPEWIMNMILNPVEMTQKDPTAQKLLEEHLTQMTFQNVTQEEARMILEYFRKKDGAK